MIRTCIQQLCDGADLVLCRCRMEWREADVSSPLSIEGAKLVVTLVIVVLQDRRARETAHIGHKQDVCICEE